MVMVDNRNNKSEYIDNNPLNWEWTSVIRVKLVDEAWKLLVIDILDNSGDEISGDELNVTSEEEEGEGKKERQGMHENQDNSKPRIVPITNVSPQWNSPGQPGEMEVKDVEIWISHEYDWADADMENITLTEQKEANLPDVEAQTQDQTDNVNMCWWITVLVRVVAVRADVRDQGAVRAAVKMLGWSKLWLAD